MLIIVEHCLVAMEICVLRLVVVLHVMRLDKAQAPGINGKRILHRESNIFRFPTLC
jgi:hypothetical protein